MVERVGRRRGWVSGMGGLALVLVAGTGAGCVSIGAWSKPTVSVADLRIDDLTLFETSGAVTIRISNENREPLLVEGAAYNLWINGVRVGQALANRPLEVPGLGTATQEVELRLNHLALATRLPGIIDRGVVDYTLKAKLYLAGGVGLRRSVRITSEGRIDLQNPAGLENPRPRSGIELDQPLSGSRSQTPQHG